ncbi:alpha/beta fold hydrolase [Nesterenkonia sp. CF4.4]|uniref:alpha/beta fold hydrolase n=1 Tax=Nesterenkonia sp. CF4.4 TaxID=3373079 RepID=UPI003EE6D644
MKLVEVDGIELEVNDVGSGDPVVLVQTALTADELAPLARHLAELGVYRVIVYHRRGYAGSHPVRGPGSMPRDAADCRRLNDALQLGPVHIVGYSYSGGVAMQLAHDTTEHVRTLTLIEPPPVHVTSAGSFRSANA